MQGEIVAEKLAFPEGPVWHDGVLYFVEIASGAVARFRPGHGVERFALPGGGPNGAALGPDNVFYITQNGGMTRENRRTPSIQHLALDHDGHDGHAGHAAQTAHDGLVSELTREVAGLTLGAPNDLAFGPDGRLYFTDPRGYPDPARNKQPGRIFAWDMARSCGELVIELGAVFPNGIAFDREGTLYWSETFSRRVMALRDDKLELIVELPERFFPDGFCIDQDGLLYVASTYGHCVSVIEDGRVIERLMCGDGMPTNCCFAGTDLYVTESRHGTLWRFAIGKGGLPLHT